MVYVMSVPAEPAAGPLLVMATSACAATVVITVELLLPGALSAVVVVMFAVLLTVPVADGDRCATTVNVALDPDVSVAMLHEIVAPVVQVNAGPVFCVSETKVVPAGSVSVQLTFEAFDGPLLITLTV